MRKGTNGEGERKRKHLFSRLIRSIAFSRAKSCTIQSLTDIEKGNAHIKEVLDMFHEEDTPRT